MNHKTNKPSCTVGLSGGVDSSVAAYLLKNEFSVSALFMKNWDDTDINCPLEDDYLRASEVASTLEIPISRIDGSKLYYDKVFKRFISDLHLGLTPNPDIWCNEFVKFELLIQAAAQQEYIATGHYARIKQHGSNYSLHRAADANKDQSYFLSRLSPSILHKIKFPLGELTKPQVRSIASELELATAHTKESMGICFIGPNNYSNFLQDYVVTRPGHIISDTGIMLGEHKGLLFYTLGQRKGHGIGGVKNHDESPWYVIDKRLDDNTLVLSQNPHHPNLMRTYCTLSDLHWFAPIPSPSTPLLGQARHRQIPQTCHLQYSEVETCITFESAQWALTPGQHLVIYDGDQVIGSGIIQPFKR